MSVCGAWEMAYVCGFKCLCVWNFVSAFTNVFVSVSVCVPTRVKAERQIYFKKPFSSTCAHWSCANYTRHSSCPYYFFPSCPRHLFITLEATVTSWHLCRQHHNRVRLLRLHTRAVSATRNSRQQFGSQLGVIAVNLISTFPFQESFWNPSLMCVQVIERNFDYVR